MSDETCCTCATLLSSKLPTYSTNLLQGDKSSGKASHNEKSEASPSFSQSDLSRQEPKDPPRQLPCCNRRICAACLKSNPRFQTYCPFCQISTTPTALPQGLKDPPAYTSQPPSPKRGPVTKDTPDDQNEPSDEPPTYSSLTSSSSAQEPSQEDVTHYLHPEDTITSLALAYNVTPAILQSHNGIFSNHLLSARRTISIPRTHYSGPSLSPDPVESEEETERKSGIRRFMVATKCHEYHVAELYLSHAKGNVSAAIDRWKDDELWEKENPLDRSKLEQKRGKRGLGGGLTGQLR